MSSCTPNAPRTPIGVRADASDGRTVLAGDALESAITGSGTTPDAASNARKPVIRPSRVSKWRAIVLIAVQLAIAIHFAHWKVAGETVSPIEPSESIQFTTSGIVNAGTIFFGLSILSTLILGRWFCGWACHIVAVQDFCRWLLMRVGIRPRLVNLGILWAVPWITFAYMFLLPVVGRLVEGSEWPAIQKKLYTDAFWSTFPPWPVAIVTIVVVGFAIVYFLGAKGYCNYGCPYGAIFGITDQLAPVRIRVTDACEGCGHCTAVCTSNVRVHQEVREWKMVVDPGCMKCLDCVSVCPKDALYVGFGVPAIAARRRAPSRAVAARAAIPGDKGTRGGAFEGAGGAVATLDLPGSDGVPPSPSVARATGTVGNVVAASAATAVKRHEPALRWLLLAVFLVSSFMVLTAFNSVVEAYVNPPDWKLILSLSALSFAVALVFRGKASRAPEFTLGEDTLMAVAFLIGAFAFRGHGWSSMLLALALAVIFAWSCVVFVRLSKRSDLRVQNLTLKRDGRIRGAGRAFVVLMLVALGTLGWAANAQRNATRGGRAEFAVVLHDTGLLRAQAGAMDEAIQLFARALEFDPASIPARENLAGSLCAVGRFAEGIAEYERAILQNPNDAQTRFLCALARVETHDDAGAAGDLAEAVRLAPERPDLRQALADVLDRLGRHGEAAAQRRAAAELPSGKPH